VLDAAAVARVEVEDLPISPDRHAVLVPLWPAQPPQRPSRHPKPEGPELAFQLAGRVVGVSRVDPVPPGTLARREKPAMASHHAQPHERPQGAAEEVMTTSPSPVGGSGAARGPLVVSAVNPRYFTAAAGGTADRKAVYLTGSHIWNNLHDGMGPGASCAEAPERLDYDAYLDFLEEHGHNFIRLWRWEQFKSQAAGGDFHLCMTPQPWARTGPGAATDGRPRFDLNRFDEAFFERLRDRVVAAGRRGIYVAVMLFDGFGLHLSPAPDHVEGHPFHAANNINRVGIGSILDHQVLPLDPRVQALQEAYIRKVVDTLHDLPNLLWEVANESSGGGQVDPAFTELLGLAGIPEWGDSTAWQYWVIDTVKRHEQTMGYDRHPIGMTMQFPVAEQTKVNDPLFDSRAEWISPGYDDEVFAGGAPPPQAPGAPPSRWLVDPPAADGRKVVITDTDHYTRGGDALWAWKSFLRGHHPILMDYGLIGGIDPPDPSAGGPMSHAAFEPARYAMGDTLRFAERMNLLAMEPRDDLSSTGYALANPGQEYLVLQPSGAGDSLTVLLEPGTYTAEWFSIESRQTVPGDAVTVERSAASGFSPPAELSGPTVLYLKVG
jgi:Family of unknown function (DUF6298)